MAKAPAKPAPGARPPFVVIYGEDEFRKGEALRKQLAQLIPPDADRDLVLTEFDGTKTEEGGGPTTAAVFDDLRTLPFLADRRIVVIRDADKFITATREALEKYAGSPSPVGTLVLVCRSFPGTTKLHRAVKPIGPIIECKKLIGEALYRFVEDCARRTGKRLDTDIAARLIDLVGPDQGILENEIEKLALYVGSRPLIGGGDVDALVGKSREEMIFTAMDAAAVGRIGPALTIWRQTLSADSDAAYRAVGGAAFKLRKWLHAHELHEEGESAYSMASKVGMWGRAPELEQLLRRLSPTRIRGLLARLAHIDSQAKVGARTIESGVDEVLVSLAGGA